MFQGEYKCLDCEDEFLNRTAAMIHAYETKHTNFELIGSDIKVKIKS